MPGLIPDPVITPAGGGADPFGTLNSLMDFQNKANQNRKFQTEFMANQALGEIIAHSPSIAEGLNNANKNPLVMGFAGEGLRNLGAFNTIQLQGAETKQKLRGSGYELAAQAGVQAMNDPFNYNKYYDNALKMVDPLVRSDVAPQIQAIKESIAAKVKGLNLNDPVQLQKAKDTIAASVAGAYTLANGSPEHLAPYMPSAQLGPGGEAVRMASPLEVLQGGGPQLMPTAAPAGLGGGPTVVTNSSSGEQYPMDAADSIRPYVSKDRNGHQVYSVYGNVSIAPVHRQDDENLKQQHTEKELPRYNADKNALSGLTQMQHAADTLTATGGFGVPGLLGSFRGQLLNGLETVQNITGKKFYGDAMTPLTDINASIGVINKWHPTLAFQLRDQFDGAGHPGLGTLMEASAAIPGMENTPLQFKVLTAGLKAIANWDAGKYEFKEAYKADPATGGSLLGSDMAYAKVASPLKAAMKELGDIGVHFDGKRLSMSEDEAEKAYARGLFGSKGSPEAEAAFSAFWEHNVVHPKE